MVLLDNFNPRIVPVEIEVFIAERLRVIGKPILGINTGSNAGHLEDPVSSDLVTGHHATYLITWWQLLHLDFEFVFGIVHD